MISIGLSCPHAKFESIELSPTGINFMNKTMKTALLLLALILANPALSQTVPSLSKNWKGISTGTSVGVTIGHNPNNPSSPDKGKQGDEFNVFTVPGTLEVVAQKGRHVDLMYRSAYGQTRYIGTISADGKLIQLASFHSSAIFNIEGDRMSGCGESRGSNGTFEHWAGNYSAWCSEFLADR